SESPRRDLARVGMLGLELMHAFVQDNREFYRQFVHEQLTKPPERRCPFARAAIEVCEILADFWEVSTGYSTSSTYQPLLLAFEQVNAITLRTFFRYWAEMQTAAATAPNPSPPGAPAPSSLSSTAAAPSSQPPPSAAATAQPSNPADDVARVAAVTRSRFRHAAEVATGVDVLAAFEKEMLAVGFAEARERQLKELEVEDDLMDSSVVRSLRERLYKESHDFIKQQRIQCLMAGAWFPVIREKGRVRGVVRFYRLGLNMKALHWGDFPEAMDDKPGLEELGERIDISLITDILTGLSSPIFSSKKNSSETPTLCFSLVSTSSSTASDATPISLADLACSSTTQYIEWTDAISMLLDRRPPNRQTLDMINRLADVAVKTALLDLTGEGLDAMLSGAAPEVPEGPRPAGQYWYEEPSNKARKQQAAPQPKRRRIFSDFRSPPPGKKNEESQPPMAKELTQEQMDRAEQNRLKALAKLKAKKEAKLKQGTLDSFFTSSPASSTGKTAGEFAREEGGGARSPKTPSAPSAPTPSSRTNAITPSNRTTPITPSNPSPSNRTLAHPSPPPAATIDLIDPGPGSASSVLPSRRKRADVAYTEPASDVEDDDEADVTAPRRRRRRRIEADDDDDGDAEYTPARGMDVDEEEEDVVEIMEADEDEDEEAEEKGGAERGGVKTPGGRSGKVAAFTTPRAKIKNFALSTPSVKRGQSFLSPLGSEDKQARAASFKEKNEVRYSWLKEGNIRDASGNSPDHEEYDVRTLYIPKEAWK
ncbi:ELMO/CED-12 family-domain-containing protein, partial [Blyttiomyces helicus]